MTLRHPLVRDLALCIAALVLAAVLLIGAASLLPPRFEPIGSAALPRAMAAIIALLGLIVGIGALRRHVSGAPLPAEDTAPWAAQGSSLKSLGVFLGLLIYVFALDKLRLPFEVATTVFVVWSGCVIGGFKPRSILGYAIFGLLLSLLVAWVLRTWLYIEF